MRKDELEEKLSERHIVLDENVKWTNEKLIKILGDYTLERSPKKLHCWGARFLQSLETVQLCRHLKDEQKAFDKIGVDPMISDDYVAEFKENGSRVFIYYSPEVGFKFFSRRESVSTFLNNELTEKILLIEKGIVTTPESYIGKYNYRFILDGEITVEGNSMFEGVAYGDVEDLMQAIIGSLPERAKRFQLDGNRFLFNIFDCIYFEKAPTGLPPEVKFDYYASDKELNEEEVAWVEENFADYLRTAAFKGYKSAKKLYAYLYSLKDSLPHDIRKYPFIKRRNIRTKLVQFLQSKQLPFIEVEGDDKDKMGYLDDVLGEMAEGIILKNIHAPYISALKSSRSHRACMKVKQSINSMLRNKEANDEQIDNSPIVVLVRTIIEQAVRQRTSDIHIEALEERVRVRYRVDGTLKEVMTYDISLIDGIVARIKISGGMDISEKRKPQDGRITQVVDKVEYDIRVSCLPTVFGEKQMPQKDLAERIRNRMKSQPKL